jgi:hypothetical protein
MADRSLPASLLTGLVLLLVFQGGFAEVRGAPLLASPLPQPAPLQGGGTPPPGRNNLKLAPMSASPLPPRLVFEAPPALAPGSC